MMLVVVAPSNARCGHGGSNRYKIQKKEPISERGVEKNLGGREVAAVGEGGES